MSETKRPSASMVVATISSKEFQAKLSASLPKGIDTDRFTRMTITAIQNKPDLLDADKDSLYLAILQCAQTGLAPDGKEAALVVFNTKVGDNRWIKQVQFMPMVTGIIKKLGEVDVKCDTAVVHELDFFEWEQGDNPKITHRPAKLGTDRGVMIGAYAILKPKGGEAYHEVMDSKQIERVRQQSRAPNSLMWTQFPEEGYRKTVLRRCAKRVPMRFEETVEKTIAADNDTFEMGDASAAKEAEPKADPTVVATQPEQSKAPAPAEKQIAAAVQRTQDEVLEESENPAPREERRAAVEAKPAAAAQPKRPQALARVLEASPDNEDIF